MELEQPIPDNVFTSTLAEPKKLSDYQGRYLILYFYPKDATPGCTTQGNDFAKHFKDFDQLNTVIFGVSRDSISSHQRFKQKQQFPFELISDPEEILCQLFAVMKKKSMFGKSVRGIERSTFLIDPQGILKKEWRKVRIPGHVAEVLQQVQQLQAQEQQE